MSSVRYDRVMSAIRREVPDRVPWALWGHFPAAPFLRYYSWEKANRDGREIARSHIALLNELDYKMDLLKVTPFYRFMAHHWGSKFRFTNNEEVVETVDVIVKESKDWEKLWVLDPKKELREHIRAVSILQREVGGRMPFIYTVPSPFIQALHGISTPFRVYADMKSQPDVLKKGLETITQTCIDFARTCIDEGADGVFFGIGGGGDLWSKMSRKQLEEYALYYDQKVLNSLKHAPIKLLHICSNEEENPQQNGGLMEEGWFKQYPVDAINWRSASFTRCPVAKEIYGDRFCLVGGLDHKEVIRNGSPQQIEAQVKEAIETTAEGGGFIIGPSCTLYQDTPLENYNAVARAVKKYGRYRR
jgi:uroporphyrinogen decarboxylase